MIQILLIQCSQCKLTYIFKYVIEKFLRHFSQKLHWQKCNIVSLAYFPIKWQQKLSCSLSSCATCYARRQNSENITWANESILSWHENTKPHCCCQHSCYWACWRPFLACHSLSVHFLRLHSETSGFCLHMYRYVHIFMCVYAHVKELELPQRQTFLYQVHISSKEKALHTKSQKDCTEIWLCSCIKFTT